MFANYTYYTETYKGTNSGKKDVYGEVTVASEAKALNVTMHAQD